MRGAHRNVTVASMLGGRTERLALEPLGHEHADGLVAALDHPSVGAFLGGPDVTTVEALHARIDWLRDAALPGEQFLNFAIRRLADGAILGRLEATVHPTWAELAYLVGPAYQRQGYAREATRWLLSALFATGATELWAAVHPANTASLRLLAALAFSPRASTPHTLGSYDPGDLLFSLRRA